MLQSNVPVPLMSGETIFRLMTTPKRPGMLSTPSRACHRSGAFAVIISHSLQPP